MLLEIYTPNLISATQWLLGNQNRDGSWGRTPTEKMRWTANAVYTLQLLGLNPQARQMAKAIDWLKHISIAEPEWYLRVPALIAVGLSDWLKGQKDFDRVHSLFETDTIGPLPIKVALATELLQAGITVPNLTLIENTMLSMLRKEEHGLASFAGSTNNTTLYCSFLSKLDYERHRDVIQRCISWVLLRQIEKPELNAVCWEESYGRTAYVVLNLIDMAHYIENEDGLYTKCVAFFRPNREGAIPADVIPAHDSLASTYTTILFVRTYAALMQERLIIYRKAFGEVIVVGRTVSYESRRWLRRAGMWGISLVLFAITGGTVYFFLGREFLLSVTASVIAAALPSLYLLVRKLYETLEDDRTV